MKVACLVLAHSGAPVLARALPLLRAAGWDVFVHLDRKVDRAQYSSKLEAGACSFLDDPYEVFWGGFAMVQAELRLLQVAAAAGPYEKYVLLSDDSFPVLPPAQLAAHFDNPRDQVTLVRQPLESPFDRRYREFFCYDHQTTTPRPFGPRTGLIDEDLERRVAQIAVLRRIGKKALQVYHGSQFWALTAATAELVTRTAQNDWQLAKSFEYGALPDELMIQSILGNYQLQQDQHTGPVYADFSIPEGPRIISTLASLPVDLQPPHVFVRKISPNAPELLDQMSAHLRAGLTIHGLDPQAHTARTNPAVIVGDSVLYRLAAPGAYSVPDPAWHGIESFGGRTYRWTALDEVTWALPGLPQACGKIRFVITPIIESRVEFRQGCRLSFAGQTLPLQLQEGSLTAEFAYSNSAATQVILRTPKLRSPQEAAGKPDTRKLGLSIAT
jgi:Core-2/I-Branching enzyme